MKAQNLSRKQFLQGNLKGKLVIRPPWSVEESIFTEKCTRCFKCAEACPSHLIIIGSSGFPEISFIRQGCDYCEACVQACPEDVLLNKSSDIPWSQKANINSNCFSETGISCRSCGEVCEKEAITFKLIIGGKAQVNIDNSLCNGCGECVHICPAQAIEIHPTNSNFLSPNMEMFHE